MQIKPEIKIVPVFDQASDTKIWSDFARLELLCRKVEYNCEEEKGYNAQVIMNGHKRTWEENKSIAFAAYDGKKMVGFAKCHSTEDKKEIYFSNLYVDPQYKGLGIGKQLLRQRERAAALFYYYVSLEALNEKVVPFFEKQGYKNENNRYMRKDLPEHMVGVVPVFKALCGLRAKIKVDYDKELVKQCKNQPLFVYVTYTGEIDAIAARTPDKSVHVWTNQHKRGMSEFYEKLLLSAMSNVK